MSNQDFDERGERFNALTVGDEGGGRREAFIPSQAFQASGDRIVGAQEVAVYRSTAKVMSELKVLAAAVGEAWYYRFPVQNRKENRTDWIEGPSIKLANDLARIYGNCDVDIRVQEAADSWVFYARFTDFETGFSLTRPFQQRKDASRMGGADNARRLDIAFQIGVSKAERNVIVNALQTYSDFAFEEAKAALVDKVGRDLAKYVDKTRERLAGYGADILKRVEALRGRPIDKWTAPDVARTIAEIQAVKDGMAFPDDTWPPIAPVVPSAPTAPSPPASEAQPAQNAPIKEGPPRTRRRAAPKEAEPAPAHDPETGELRDPPSSGWSEDDERGRHKEDDQFDRKGGPNDPAVRAAEGAQDSAAVEEAADPPAEENNAPAAAPSPPPAPPKLSAEDVAKLKVLANAAASQNTSGGVNRLGGRFFSDNDLGDDDPRPLAVKAVAILHAHLARTNGQSSVAEADAAVRKVLQP